MREDDMPDLIALVNFLVEERAYTAEALFNEMFLYVNFVESNKGCKMFHENIFKIVDGKICVPVLLEHWGWDKEVKCLITYGDEMYAFTKGGHPWESLTFYRNLRNTMVGK